MPEIGIAIVTYNSESEIGACLDAALASGADVVVVDNASQDGTIAQIARRGARLIANSTNRGFAGAVNQGFEALDCPYILMLNPDAVLMCGLNALREACDLEGAAGASGCLVDPGGRQTGFMVRRLPTPAALILEVLLLNRLWPNNPVNRRYRCLDMDYSVRCAVEQPAGAFLMVRRAVWHELGGLDERFWPVWFEDVDFCHRMKDRNYLLYYVPEAVAKHTGAHSISRIPVETRRFCWYSSLLRYTARHFGPIAFRVVSLAVAVGSILRIMADWAAGRLRVRAYGRVVRLAIGCLLFGWRDEVV
jgi:GT2 family glycosyltransferase